MSADLVIKFIFREAKLTVDPFEFLNFVCNFVGCRTAYFFLMSAKAYLPAVTLQWGL